MFSTLCICMQIIVWKTNYVIVHENDTMFETVPSQDLLGIGLSCLAHQVTHGIDRADLKMQ